MSSVWARWASQQTAVEWQRQACQGSVAELALSVSVAPESQSWALPNPPVHCDKARRIGGRRLSSALPSNAADVRRPSSAVSRYAVVPGWSLNPRPLGRRQPVVQVRSSDRLRPAPRAAEEARQPVWSVSCRIAGKKTSLPRSVYRTRHRRYLPVRQPAYSPLAVDLAWTRGGRDRAIAVQQVARRLPRAKPRTYDMRTNPVCSPLHNLDK